jgi:hypothetical protein
MSKLLSRRLRKPSGSKDDVAPGRAPGSWRRWVALIAGFLAVAFGLLYTLGWVLGRSSSPPDEKLINIAASHLRLDYVPERKQLLLVYECVPAKHRVRRFDVAHDALLPNLTYRSVTQSGRWNAWQSHRDVALAMVGTGTFAAALTAVERASEPKDQPQRKLEPPAAVTAVRAEDHKRKSWFSTFKETRQGKALRALAIAVGMATGYLIGYDHGSQRALDCDNDTVDSLVSNAENWRSLKRRYVEMQLTLITVPQSEAERARMREDAVRQIHVGPIESLTRSTQSDAEALRRHLLSGLKGSEDRALLVPELLIRSEQALAAYHRLVACNAEIAKATEQLKADMLAKPDRLPGRNEFATIYLLQASVKAAVRGAAFGGNPSGIAATSESGLTCDSFKLRMESELVAQLDRLPEPSAR